MSDPTVDWLRGLTDYSPSESELRQQQADIEEQNLLRAYAERLRQKELAARMKQDVQNPPTPQPTVEAPLDMSPRVIEALRQAGVEQ